MITSSLWRISDQNVFVPGTLDAEGFVLVYSLQKKSLEF